MENDWEEWDPAKEKMTVIPDFNDIPVYKGGLPYDQVKALNWSTLSRFLKNPSYFQRYPDWKYDVKAFGLGTYIHRMLLQENEYKNRYAEFQAPINQKTGEPYKSGKAYQEALEAFENSGMFPIPENGEKILDEIKLSLKAFELDSFLKGNCEVPVIIDAEGLTLKGTIDVYSDSNGIIDLKTTSSQLNVNGNDYYRWKIKEFGYAEQLAYYATIVKLETGVLPPCSILAVQTTAPYQVGVYSFSSELIEKTSATILNEYLPAWKEYLNGKIPKIFTYQEINFL